MIFFTRTSPKKRDRIINTEIISAIILGTTTFFYTTQ